PARGHIDRDGRGGEEIVAWALVAHPRAAVPHSPERQVRFWVIIPGHPNRAATCFPLVALRPGLAAGLSGSGHRINSPQLLSRVSVASRDEAPDSELTARRTDQHFPRGDLRRQ